MKRDLGPFLEAVYERFHTLRHVEQDPLRFPRRYHDPVDQEVVGLLSASLAFGRVAAFLPVLEALFARLGPCPSQALRDLDQDSIGRIAQGLGYRFVRQAHLASMLSGIQELLRSDGSLHPAFMSGFSMNGQAIEGLLALSGRIRLVAPEPGPGFMLPLGRPNDPAKRLNLFLRWMVRDDGIDLGVWKDVPTSSLLMPMDVHVLRVSRFLGLLPDRASGPRLADARSLAETLRKYDPEDPVRFDFALSHLGISGECKGRSDPVACGSCVLAEACRWG